MKRGLHIEVKMFRKNCWVSSILLCLLVMCSSCIQNKITYEDWLIDTRPSTAPSYVKMRIKYQDCIYNAIVEEDYAYFAYSRFSENPEIQKTTLKKEFYKVLEKGILDVDIKTYQYLKDTIKAFVTPQFGIDLIYNRDKNSLLIFFNANKVIDTPLSYDEEKYLISLLFENGMYVIRDCETGYLFLANGLFVFAN